MQMPAAKASEKCRCKHYSPQKKGQNFLPARQASEGSCEPACCNAHAMS